MNWFLTFFFLQSVLRGESLSFAAILVKWVYRPEATDMKETGKKHHINELLPCGFRQQKALSEALSLSLFFS